MSLGVDSIAADAIAVEEPFAAAGTTHELTAAAFNFTAQSLNSTTGALFELGSAAFNFTAQSLTYFTDLVHELTTAAFSFVGRALNYTTGAAAAAFGSLLTYFRRRGRR